MNDHEERAEPSHKPSWLERIGMALSGEPKDREDIVALLREAKQRDVLDADALMMMEGVLRVSETHVRDVMLPRAQMVVLEQDWQLERLVAAVVESGHSRLPVIDDTKDNVIGILIVKDLIAHLFQRREHFDLKSLLRPAHFIPESKRLNVLLKEFRSNRLHMAMVVDEYGGVSGLITIEDVLEEIVGEIDDEHDTDEASGAFIRPYGAGFLTKALTPVAEFNAFFRVELDEERADTIGGLVLLTFGRLPKGGETVDMEGFRFKVLRADNRRLHLLEVTRLADMGAELRQTES